MADLVLDASALAGWFLPAETGPDLARLAAEGAAFCAPWPLWAEIRNILIVLERRGRLPAGLADEALAAIEGLGLALDTAPSGAEVMRLARRHGLTVCDALCLELAQRRGARLATLEAALGRAAGAEGVALAGELGGSLPPQPSVPTARADLRPAAGCARLRKAAGRRHRAATGPMTRGAPARASPLTPGIAARRPMPSLRRTAPGGGSRRGAVVPSCPGAAGEPGRIPQRRNRPFAPGMAPALRAVAADDLPRRRPCRIAAGRAAGGARSPSAFAAAATVGAAGTILPPPRRPATVEQPPPKSRIDPVAGLA